MLNMKWLGGATALVLVLTASLPVLAEDLTPADGWQRNFEAGLNILQSSYSSNWHGGEKGSIVWAARFDGQMEKQMSDLTNWRNTLKLVYGQTHNQNRDASGDLVWKRPDKSDDIIDFESLFRFTPDSWVDPFVALNFTSMVRDLTDPSGRTLNLNPMTFKETAGMARELINEDGRFMMTRLGFAFSQNVRATFVNAAPDEETSAEMTTEAGLEMVTEYKDVVLEEKVTWESKLTLALPLVYSGKSVFEDDVTATALAAYGIYDSPEDIAGYTTTINADLENVFTTQITSLISVKLFVHWLYKKYDNTVKPVVDDTGALTNGGAVNAAIRKSGQFKQTLALWLTYKFD